MNYVYVVSILLIISIIGCGENAHIPTELEVDELPLMNIPGSIVDVEHLNEYLSKFDLHIPGSFLNPWDKRMVLENVDKLKKALNNASAHEDEKLTFVLHGMLGKEYKDLGYFHEDDEALKKAKKHTQIAIESAKNKTEFDTDVALLKSNLAFIYLYIGDGDKAFDVLVHLIENYQDVGIGDYPQWFAVQHTRYLSSSANRFTGGDDYHPYAQKVFEYFGTLQKSKSHDEHIRIVAAIELYDYYNRTGAVEEAKTMRSDIDMLIDNDTYENETIKQRWDIVLKRAEYHRKARESEIE